MRPLPISYLIQIAEEKVEESRRGLEAVEWDAKEWNDTKESAREWCRMLEALRNMKDHGIPELLPRRKQRMSATIRAINL